MSRVILMAFACCILTRAAVSSEASKYTLGVFSVNGGIWMKMNKDSKTWWLLGYREGIMTGAVQPYLDSFDHQKGIIVEGFITFTTLSPLPVNAIAALDKFYSDYKNINISVSEALFIITSEIHGTEKQKIELMLEMLRKADAPTVGDTKDKK